MRPNILSNAQKHKSFSLGEGNSFANSNSIEIEVYEDDDEDVIAQDDSEELPSSNIDTIDSDPNNEVLLPDDMEVKIEVEEPEFINCDDIDEGSPPKKKFAFSEKPKQETCVKSCSYDKCTNNTRKNPKLTLYPFPNNQSKLFMKQYNEWVVNSGLSGLSDTAIKQKFICEDHFDDSAFVNPSVKGRLKSTAIPKRCKGFVPPPTQPVISSVSTVTTPKAMPVISILTDPTCAVCSEKLNIKYNYVKVPDHSYVRSLWEISTEKKLTAYDLICEKHFAFLDIPSHLTTNVNRGNGAVNIYNHRPTCLPCLTPIAGCCIPKCPNENNNNITLFTFDLRHTNKWLKRIGEPLFYKKSKKELLRLRACPNHFNPYVLRKYKFFETELIITRNLPDGKAYPEDQNLDTPSSSNTTTPVILTPVRVLGNTGGTPLQFVPNTVTSTVGRPVVTPKPPRVEKIVINRLQCLFKNCPRMANTTTKFFKPPRNLARAKKWLEWCNRSDILRLPDVDLDDFLGKAEGICEVHIGSVYKENNESRVNRMICGYKSCQSTYSTGSKVFQFPLDPDLSKKWFRAAGIKSEPKTKELPYFTKNIGICISHFRDEDFNENRELLSNAIPQSVENSIDDHADDDHNSNKEWTDYADPQDAKNKSGIFNTCVVPQCTNNIKLSPVPFHYFPNAQHDSSRYQLWIEMIRESQIKSVPSAVVCKMYRICSDHFEDFFFMDPDRKKLRNVAVPSVSVPGKTNIIKISPFYYLKLERFLLKHKITDFIQLDTEMPAPERVAATSPYDPVNTEPVLPVIPPRVPKRSRLMQWIAYEPAIKEKDQIRTKCTIEVDGLSFPNLGKRLCLADEHDVTSNLPFDIYKFDLSSLELTEELKPGSQLQIHTAIIIDDDDECERQAMHQIFKLLKRQEENDTES